VLFMALAIALLIYSDSGMAVGDGMTGNQVNTFKVTAPPDLGIDSVTFQGSRTASSVQSAPGAAGAPRKITVANAPQLYYAAVYPGSSPPGMYIEVACLKNPAAKIPINAEIRDSEGRVDARLALVDDGQHYDGKAGDGCYGGVIDGRELVAGDYSVSLTAAAMT